MAGITSPDINNISVGTGHVSFKPVGDSVYHHLGNAPSLQCSMKTKTLDYYRPVNGIKVKAQTFVIEQEAEVDVALDEITAQNLALVLMGNITSPGGVTHVSIEAINGKSGALKYTATNEVGPRWHIDLFYVTFNNGGEYAPLGGGDFTVIRVKGAVLSANGIYGDMTLL